MARVTKVRLTVEFDDGESYSCVINSTASSGDNPRFLSEQVLATGQEAIRVAALTMEARYPGQIVSGA